MRDKDRRTRRPNYLSHCIAVLWPDEIPRVDLTSVLVISGIVVDKLIRGPITRIADLHSSG